MSQLSPRPVLSSQGLDYLGQASPVLPGSATDDSQGDHVRTMVGSAGGIKRFRSMLDEEDALDG